MAFGRTSACGVLFRAGRALFSADWLAYEQVSVLGAPGFWINPKDHKALDTSGRQIAIGAAPASVLAQPHNGRTIFAARNHCAFLPNFAAAQADWPPHVSCMGFAFYDKLDSASNGLLPELTQFLDAGPLPLVFTLGSSAVFDPGIS